MKEEILNDVKNTNNKFLSSYEAGLSRFDELERQLKISEDSKSLAIQEVENKISILEDLTSNQFTLIKNEITATNKKVNTLENNYNQNYLHLIFLLVDQILI